jgi:hypothetical protein
MAPFTGPLVLPLLAFTPGTAGWNRYGDSDPEQCPCRHCDGDFQ